MEGSARPRTELGIGAVRFEPLGAVETAAHGNAALEGLGGARSHEAGEGASAKDKARPTVRIEHRLQVFDNGEISLAQEPVCLP